MARQVILTTDESASLERLGQRLRRARLRRNLTQADVAERAGINRKVVVALEAGAAGTGIGALVKVLAVMGYPERIADLLESDPIGEDLEEVFGRKRAGKRDGMEDF